MKEEGLALCSWEANIFLTKAYVGILSPNGAVHCQHLPISTPHPHPLQKPVLWSMYNTILSIKYALAPEFC